MLPRTNFRPSPRPAFSNALYDTQPSFHHNSTLNSSQEVLERSGREFGWKATSWVGRLEELERKFQDAEAAMGAKIKEQDTQIAALVEEVAELKNKID